MAVLIQPKWPQTTADLQACLSAPLGSCTSCQGRSKTKPTCKNSISKDSREKISSVVLDILASGSLSSAARHLERLASLVLCKRWHQEQTTDKTAEWKRRIREFLGLNGNGKQDGGKGEAEAEPEGRRSRTAAVSVKATESNIAKSLNAGRLSVADGVDSKPLVEKRPVSLVVKQETVKEEDDEYKSRLEIIPFNPLPIKSAICPTPLKKPTVHTFTPYQQPLSTRKINITIVDKLLAPSTQEEQKPRGTGYIYGYKLPKGHTTALGTDTDRMIKIGYTNNYKRRMRQWQSKCHYTPNLIFAREAPYYIKMEEVVHLHLANERRWDMGCAGCREPNGKTTNHKEFFEVDAEKAQAVVEMWAAWAGLGPFDEEGRLTAYWAARLDALDLDDDECWYKFVLDKGKTKKSGSKLVGNGGVA
ncbi:T5orf172 domain-containing protein [Colletotrichum navitas]|uniref:T5orf172 domain-containing protein n=1 Tax=Colletotrichum navitas TaxID=681940 RepID=A0AAD8PX95_9PEZI|nr:T5orf172 domain-containing protein [Colletotrichum navitas]KAK1589626.1 T5orf172 domain-containing protein [Colletotrichum navitas]